MGWRLAGTGVTGTEEPVCTCEVRLRGLRGPGGRGPAGRGLRDARGRANQERGMEELRRLAGLVREKNAVEREIAALTGRPALPGHVGEYVAAAIFDLALHPSAGDRGSDGVFRSGPVAGRSVNMRPAFWGD